MPVVDKGLGLVFSWIEYQMGTIPLLLEYERCWKSMVRGEKKIKKKKIGYTGACTRVGGGGWVGGKGTHPPTHDQELNWRPYWCF